MTWTSENHRNDGPFWLLLTKRYLRPTNGVCVGEGGGGVGGEEWQQYADLLVISSKMKWGYQVHSLSFCFKCLTCAEANLQGVKRFNKYARTISQTIITSYLSSLQVHLSFSMLLFMMRKFCAWKITPSPYINFLAGSNFYISSHQFIHIRPSFPGCIDTDIETHLSQPLMSPVMKLYILS